jgi:hypothetical protein
MPRAFIVVAGQSKAEMHVAVHLPRSSNAFMFVHAIGYTVRGHLCTWMDTWALGNSYQHDQFVDMPHSHKFVSANDADDCTILRHPSVTAQMPNRGRWGCTTGHQQQQTRSDIV